MSFSKNRGTLYQCPFSLKKLRSLSRYRSSSPCTTRECASICVSERDSKMSNARLVVFVFVSRSPPMQSINSWLNDTLPKTPVGPGSTNFSSYILRASSWAARRCRGSAWPSTSRVQSTSLPHVHARHAIEPKNTTEVSGGTVPYASFAIRLMVSSVAMRALSIEGNFLPSFVASASK